MMEAIDEKPAAVMVNANNYAFRTYKRGVISRGCTHKSVNHSVTVVGYNTNRHGGHWIVRNSWGNRWGEKGYVRIAMADSAGICGIN